MADSKDNCVLMSILPNNVMKDALIARRYMVSACNAMSAQHVW
jgi:hypothetical protein